MISVFNGRADQAVMASLTTPAQLGLYSVAVTVAELPQQVAEAIRSVAFAESNHRADMAIIARAARLLLFLISGIGLGLGLAASALLPLLFGESFAGALPMMWVLLVGTVSLAGASVIGSGLVAINRQGRQALAQVSGLVLAMCGLFVLVPLLGGLGAAILTAVAYTIIFGLMLLFFRRETGIPVRDCVVPQRQDVAWLRKQWGRRASLSSPQ
jgi:O-antigen/teichoic acid export membrane protein